MAFFSGDPGKEVLKGVPPDKSVGARPSVQEQTTGTGNVGMSPRSGTNEEHQSLNVQGNPHEHSDVLNQVVTPTEERPGTFLLPRPRPVHLREFPGPKEVLNMQSFMQFSGEFTHAHENFLKLTPCAEIYRKSLGKVLVDALECSASLIVNLEGFNELVPHLRDEMTGKLNRVIEIFLRQTEIDPMTLKCLKEFTSYQQLLIKSADIKVLEDRAEQERAEEAAAAEAAASLNLIEMSLSREVEEKAIADMQALEKVAKQGKAEALKSTEELGVQVQEKAEKRSEGAREAEKRSLLPQKSTSFEHKAKLGNPSQ